MAIKLDLYHETRSAQKVARRDPLKLGVYALISLAILMALYYTWQLAAVHSAQQNLTKLQVNWTNLSKQQTAASARETECNETIKNAAVFQNEIDHRFFWAPLLSVIAETVSANVQITKITGAVDSAKTDGNVGTSLCSIKIDGIAAGKIPREAAEKFRVALQSNFEKHYKEAAASFKSLDDSTVTVPVDDERLNTATFNIHVEFPLPKSDVKTSPSAAKP